MSLSLTPGLRPLRRSGPRAHRASEGTCLAGSRGQVLQDKPTHPGTTVVPRGQEARIPLTFEQVTPGTLTSQGDVSRQGDLITLTACCDHHANPHAPPVLWVKDEEGVMAGSESDAFPSLPTQHPLPPALPPLAFVDTGEGLPSSSSISTALTFFIAPRRDFCFPRSVPKHQ